MTSPTATDVPPGRRIGALVLCGLVLASGCLGAQSVPGEPDATPATGGSLTATAVDVTDYAVNVSDHWDAGGPAIEGGIEYAPDGEYTGRYYVTTVSTATEADRFDHGVLRPAASAFVRNTAFETQSLVVIQAFPASSHPDYRVESVRRRGGTVLVAVNDSSHGATADITVETVLLRVPDPVDRAVVTTEDGTTVDSSAGVVTPAPTPTRTPEQSLADVAESKRLADPGDLRVESEVGETVGYEVTIEYRYEPACRGETPACSESARWVTVDRYGSKLRTGGDATLADVAPTRGTYRVRVTADLPAGNDSRREVTETFTWRVDESGATAVVAVTGDGPAFSALE